jgi:16S rRNA (cytidine1402-2'-O)-methyltransferase
VETLKAVSLVACEDTRRTLRLLTSLQIRVRLVSIRQANERSAAGKVLAALSRGEDAAYVTDAGTPALSDPGAALVLVVTSAGYEALPVPGVSAFACIVSVAGAQDKTIVFEGFLSPKGSRRKRRVAELMGGGTGFVVYESPFRIFKLLKDIADFDSGRYVCVGREMTKLHEEFLRGSASFVYNALGGAGGVEMDEDDRADGLAIDAEEGAGGKISRGEFAVYVSAFAFRDEKTA